MGIDGSVSVTFTRMSSALGWLKPFCAGAKKEEGEKKKMFLDSRKSAREHEFNKWLALGWF